MVEKLLESVKQSIEENKFNFVCDDMNNPKVAVIILPIEKILESKRAGMAMLLGYMEVYKDFAKAILVSEMNKKMSNEIIRPNLVVH